MVSYKFFCPFARPREHACARTDSFVSCISSAHVLRFVPRASFAMFGRVGTLFWLWILLVLSQAMAASRALVLLNVLPLGWRLFHLSLIHISEPTRRTPI
eukprot:1045988-Pleurochrysis_carterae.AAC.1